MNEMGFIVSLERITNRFGSRMGYHCPPVAALICCRGLTWVAYRRPSEYLTSDALVLVQRPGGGGTSLGQDVVSIPSIMYEIKKYSRTF